MLPLECRYLNKNALTTLAGPLTPPVKHFQLKRKPKSATLRAELLQKCECCGFPWKHALPRCLRASWRCLGSPQDSQVFPKKVEFILCKQKAKASAFTKEQNRAWEGWCTWIRQLAA